MAICRNCHLEMGDKPHDSLLLGSELDCYRAWAYITFATATSLMNLRDNMKSGKLIKSSLSESYWPDRTEFDKRAELLSDQIKRWLNPLAPGIPTTPQNSPTRPDPFSGSSHPGRRFLSQSPGQEPTLPSGEKTDTSEGGSTEGGSQPQ